MDGNSTEITPQVNDYLQAIFSYTKFYMAAKSSCHAGSCRQQRNRVEGVGVEGSASASTTRREGHPNGSWLGGDWRVCVSVCMVAPDARCEGAPRARNVGAAWARKVGYGVGDGCRSCIY